MLFLKVPNFVLEVLYNMFTCIQGEKKTLLLIHSAYHLISSRDSVFLNPTFQQAYFVLIGQTA